MQGALRTPHPHPHLHPLPLTPIPNPNPDPTQASYGPNEDPSTFDSLRPWGETNMVQWRHVLHYRDLYQQKLAYVREFLSSVDRLEHWTSQVRVRVRVRVS